MTFKPYYLSALLLPAVALLTGCAGMNTHFNCNKVGGIKSCVTMGEVNGLANNGYFARKAEAEKKENLAGLSIAGKPVNASAAQSASTPSQQATQESSLAFPMDNTITKNAQAPLRVNPSVQNIWIAPYVSSNGTYNWPSTITVVVNKGQWIGAPVNVTKLSGE